MMTFEKLFNSILTNLPTGQVEPRGAFSQTDIAPSIRLHGKTLLDSFVEGRDNNDVVFVIRDDKLNVDLNLVVDHPTYGVGKDPDVGIVEWLSLGTNGAYIEAHPLAFHWGYPLRWPPKDDQSDGPRWFEHVDHPGVTPERDFIGETTDEWEGIFNRTFDDLMHDTLSLLRGALDAI